MKKKRWIVAIFIAVLIVFLVSSWYIWKQNAERTQEVISSEETSITRYEWVKMLCEQVGISEYKSEVSYFGDIEEDNSYFPYVQAAAEWGIIDKDEQFNGKEAANGEFIAITTMKAIGEYKIQIHEELSEELTDEKYIEMATENRLITETELEKTLSKTECEAVLEQFRDLYFGTYLKDDYTKVVYKEGVIEIPIDVSFEYFAERSEIIIQDEKYLALSKGTILIFEEKATGLKMARKIVQAGANGNYLLGSVDLEQVIETLVVSDITQITSDNIIKYYGLNEDEEISANTVPVKAKKATRVTALSGGKVESKGFKIKLSTKEEDDKNILCVSFTDNNTGLSYELPTQIAVDEEDLYSAEINIDSIIVSTQIDYSAMTGVNYADITAEAQATVSSNMEIPLGDDIKIPLCKTPAPLGNGFVGIDVEIYLFVSAEGSISLEAEIPMQASVRYEKEKGLSNFECDIEAKEPALKATCEMKCMIRLEPTLVILMCLDVMDVQMDCGTTIKAEITQYPTEQKCSDLTMAFPVTTISICGNDDKKTAVGLLGWSAEWEIITEENAPMTETYHYEVLPNGTSQYVDKCTYEEETDVVYQEESLLPNEKMEEVILNHTCFTKDALINIVESYVYSFAYPDNWTIIQEVVPVATYKREEAVGPLYEGITIANARGVEIQYVSLNPRHIGEWLGDTYYTVNVTEVSSSLLETPPRDDDYDSVYMPKYIVAKIDIVEMLTENSSFDNIKVGDTYYAVIPSDFLRQWGRARSCEYEGLSLMYFDYTYYTKHELDDISSMGGFAFFAMAPDGQFSEQEEREVVTILESFQGGIYEEDVDLYESLHDMYYKEYLAYMKDVYGWE